MYGHHIPPLSGESRIKIMIENIKIRYSSLNIGWIAAVYSLDGVLTKPPMCFNVNGEVYVKALYT